MTENYENLRIISGSEIEPKEVDWLWYPYIPYGKITIVQGDPGEGKSTFVLNLAAMLTTGTSLPYSTEEYEPMNVIYQNTEDDAEDTVVPRFICFLQVQIPEICRQKWRILHLRFGESCRLPGRIA